jgi:hypothetical protein
VGYNRKGPRGNSLQHYTHLKRINHEKLKQQRLVEVCVCVCVRACVRGSSNRPWLPVIRMTD